MVAAREFAAQETRGEGVQCASGSVGRQRHHAGGLAGDVEEQVFAKVLDGGVALAIDVCLARLGPRSFCALVPSDSPLELENQLARLTFPSAAVDLPDNRLRLDLALSIRVAFLSELSPLATADSLWGYALAVSGEDYA